MAQIYARPLPPVERMQEVQRLVRDPKETPMDTIKAAQLIKQARPPVAYTPRSLSQAASQAQLPVTPRPAPRPDPRLVPQPRVLANVPPPISPEDEAGFDRSGLEGENQAIERRKRKRKRVAPKEEEKVTEKIEETESFPTGRRIASLGGLQDIYQNIYDRKFRTG